MRRNSSSGIRTTCAVMPSTEWIGRSTTESGVAAGAERNQNHRELPHFALESAFVRQPPHDRIGAPQASQAFARERALVDCISGSRNARVHQPHHAVDLAWCDLPARWRSRRPAGCPAPAPHDSCANRPSRQPIGSAAASPDPSAPPAPRIPNTGSESPGRARETDDDAKTRRECPAPRRSRALHLCRTTPAAR